MQPGTPFQFLQMLGSCQVGKVWSAVDAQGRAVTVAVLDAPVAADQRWREAFASTANALKGRDGRPNFLHADFSAPEQIRGESADASWRRDTALGLALSAAAPLRGRGRARSGAASPARSGPRCAGTARPHARR